MSKNVIVRYRTRPDAADENARLVQEVYAALKARPEITLQWIKAHNGTRWNEYADSLATAWTRETL